MPRDMVEIETPADLMSPDQVRATWFTELRRQGNRQCVGPYEGNNVCAIYLLHEIQPSRQRPWSPRQSAKDAGFSDDQIDVIIHANDKLRMTFSQIADMGEGWFR